MKTQHITPALTEECVKAAFEKIGIGDVPNFNVEWNHKKEQFEIESNELLHWHGVKMYPGFRTIRIRAKQQKYFDDGTYGINFHKCITASIKANGKQSIVFDDEPLVTIFFKLNGLYDDHDWLIPEGTAVFKLIKPGMGAKGSVRKNTRTFTIQL